MIQKPLGMGIPEGAMLNEEQVERVADYLRDIYKDVRNHPSTLTMNIPPGLVDNYPQSTPIQDLIYDENSNQCQDIKLTIPSISHDVEDNTIDRDDEPCEVNHPVYKPPPVYEPPPGFAP